MKVQLRKGKRCFGDLLARCAPVTSARPGRFRLDTGHRHSNTVREVNGALKRDENNTIGQSVPDIDAGIVCAGDGMAGSAGAG